MKDSRKLSLALCILMGTNLAHAQYQVVVNTVGWSTASYNWQHVGGYVHLASFGSPSASTTPDTNGLATSAFGNVSGNGDGYPHNPNTFNIIRSSADLSSASVNMFEYDTGTDGVYTGADGGTTFSQLSDNLTFHVAGATASTVTTIGFTFVVAGHLRQSGSWVDGHGENLSSWNLAGLASGQVNLKLDRSSNNMTYVNGVTGSGAFNTTNIERIVQTGSFNVTGPSQAAAIMLQMQTWAYSGMDEAFQSYITFDMSSDVTLTSSSGVFGTRPVPEPTSIFALASGMIVLLMRRRRG